MRDIKSEINDLLNKIDNASKQIYDNFASQTNKQPEQNKEETKSSNTWNYKEKENLNFSLKGQSNP